MLLISTGFLLGITFATFLLGLIRASAVGSE